jgi:hypothetical protein
MILFLFSCSHETDRLRVDLRARLHGPALQIRRREEKVKTFRPAIRNCYDDKQMFFFKPMF